MGRARCRRLWDLLRSRRWRPGHRYGVSRGISFSDTLWDSKLNDEVEDLLQQVDPTFEFNAIQVNRHDPVQWPACEIHTDANNLGPSRAIVIGDFEGGALLLFKAGLDAQPTRIPAWLQWIPFDGHLYHGSEPVIEGIRFSIVACQFADRVG